MTWVSIAVGVGGALIGGGSAYLGGKKQADAAKDAANLNMNQFGILNAQQQPFIQSGYGALGRLNTLLGLSPNPNGMRMPGGMGGPPPSAYQVNDGGMVPGGPMSAMSANQGQQHNLSLKRILSIRAANGDQQAAKMLGMV